MGSAAGGGRQMSLASMAVAAGEDMVVEVFGEIGVRFVEEKIQKLGFGCLKSHLGCLEVATFFFFLFLKS